MLKRMLAIAAVALVVSSCAALDALTVATTDNPAVPKTLIAACEGAAAAENIIADFIRSRHIKPVSFPAINRFREPIRGLCDPEVAMPEDLAGAAMQVYTATLGLRAFIPKQ